MSLVVLLKTSFLYFLSLNPKEPDSNKEDDKEKVRRADGAGEDQVDRLHQRYSLEGVDGVDELLNEGLTCTPQFADEAEERYLIFILL